MKPTTVDEYITAAPAEAQAFARELRAIIKATAPDAEEFLSYGMPYYKLNGRLVYWGAYPKHIAVYAMGASRDELAEQLEPYRQSKATLHFPLDKPLPKELITDIIAVQAAANRAK